MGTALTAILQNQAAIVLLLAQLQGMLPQGRGGCSQCWATKLSGSRDAGSAQAASPVPGSPAGSCLKLFLRSVRLHILASLGKDVFTKFSVPTAWPQALSARLPVGPLNGPGPHSLFLWLKGRNHRERTFSTSFSIPLKWRQGCPVGLVELLSVKTLNTEPF